MWTRSKNKEDGTFGFEVFGEDGRSFLAIGGFVTAQAADRAAEKAQRDVLFGSNDMPNMTDDELLAALGV